MRISAVIFTLQLKEQRKLPNKTSKVLVKLLQKLAGVRGQSLPLLFYSGPRAKGPKGRVAATCVPYRRAGACSCRVAPTNGRIGYFVLLHPTVVASFTPVRLKPARLFLCPERQRKQNALGWVPSVRSGGKFFRLYILGAGKSGVCSHCSLCRENATLRKNLHYYLGASQLLGCVQSALRVNSASPSATPVISLAFVMVSFTRLPFGNGQPTFADRSSSGFSRS